MARTKQTARKTKRAKKAKIPKKQGEVDTSIDTTPVPSGALQGLLDAGEDVVARVFTFLNWTFQYRQLRVVCKSFQHVIFTRQECLAQQSIVLDPDNMNRYLKYENRDDIELQREEKIEELSKKLGIDSTQIDSVLTKHRDGKMYALRQNMVGRGMGRRRGRGFGKGGRKRRRIDNVDTPDIDADTEQMILGEVPDLCQEPCVPLDFKVNFARLLEIGADTFGLFDKSYVEKELVQLEMVEQRLYNKGMLPFEETLQSFYEQVRQPSGQYHAILYDPVKEGDASSKDVEDDGDDIDEDEDRQDRVGQTRRAKFDLPEDDDEMGTLSLDASNTDEDDKAQMIYDLRMGLYGNEFWGRGHDADIALYYKLELDRRQREGLWLCYSLAKNLGASASSIELNSAPEMDCARRETESPVWKWLVEKQRAAENATQFDRMQISFIDFEDPAQPAQDAAQQNGTAAADATTDATAAATEDGDIEMEDASGSADVAVEEAVDLNQLIFGLRPKNILADFISKMALTQGNQQNQQQQRVAGQNNEEKAKIDVNDSICTKEALESWLTNPVPYYEKLTLKLIYSCHNLSKLKLSHVECHPVLLKGILFSLPALEELQVLISFLNVDIENLNQYKKVLGINPRYERLNWGNRMRRNPIAGNATTTTAAEDDTKELGYDAQSPVQQWGIANKEELGKISKRLHTIHISTSEAFSFDPHPEVVMFAQWLILLTRRQLKKIHVGFTDQHLHRLPLASWIRRYDQDTFDNSLTGDLFPKLEELHITEYCLRRNERRNTSYDDVAQFLREVNTLQKLDLALGDNFVPLLCEISKIARLKETLQHFGLNATSLASNWGDQMRRDEICRNLRNTAALAQDNSHRFRKTVLVKFENNISIDTFSPEEQEYQREVQFVHKLEQHVTRLLATVFVGPSTKEISVNGYDQAFIDALWSCGKELKSLTIASQTIDSDFFNTLATISPPQLESLCLGDAEILLNEVEGNYLQGLRDFLARVPSAQFSSLKTVFKRCRNLRHLDFGPLNVTRDESELVAHGIPKTDARSMMRGGLLRAYAEALMERAAEEKEQMQMDEAPGLPAAKKQSEDVTLGTITSYDIDALSLEEMRQYKPYLSKVKTLTVSRSLSHDTFVKLQTAFADTLEVLHTEADSFMAIDMFTLMLLNRTFTKAKNMAVSRQWSYNTYDNAQLRTVLLKQEELELARWKVILQQPLAEPLFNFRSKWYNYYHQEFQNLPYALAMALLLSQEKDKEQLLVNMRMSFTNNEQVLICKRIRSEYDAKYNGAYSKLKLKDKRLLKTQFVEAIQLQIMLRVMQQWVRYEGEENQLIQKNLIEAINEKQDKEFLVKEEDIINKIVDLAMRCKTFIPRSKQLYDSDDDESRLAPKKYPTRPIGLFGRR